MKRIVLAGFALACLPLAQADVAPSTLMRNLPAIPAAPQAADCESAEALRGDIEQRAMAEMMHAQQLAMSGMTAGGSMISDKQGALVERLLDPALTMCEMQSLQAPRVDPESTYRDRIHDIQARTDSEIESRCPVTGMADYRDPACVDPITKRGLAAEREALTQFVAEANASVRRDIDVAAQCAETRDALAAEAESAKLPAQYLSIAFSGRSNAWQQLGSLAETRDNFCATAASENERLHELENLR